jgi:hypothetical protein
MQPLATMPTAVRHALRGVLFDIDDTLTTHGKLTASAYSALESLQTAGLLTIAVTGRPAGWCDHIARMWPVDGVVGENGALYFRSHDGIMIQRYFHDATARAQNRRRLDKLRDLILAAIPGCATASDQAYRDADLAIDFCEDVPPLPPAQVARIVALFEDAGATAKISSIHVNGWFGDYDKLSMARRMLGEQFGCDLDGEQSRFVFIGDSPNDAPMFEFFDHAIGVANVRNFAADMATLPRDVTVAQSGAGFVEMAAMLTQADR